eukprot:1139866-Pelagomonas_calceolata.AAC.8
MLKGNTLAQTTVASVLQRKWRRAYADLNNFQQHTASDFERYYKNELFPMTFSPMTFIPMVHVIRLRSSAQCTTEESESQSMLPWCPNPSIDNKKCCAFRSPHFEQKVPSWEPPETEVVPILSPRGGEVVVKVFAPRMTPFLNQRSGLQLPSQPFPSARHVAADFSGQRPAEKGDKDDTLACDQWEKVQVDPTRQSK